MRIFDHSDISFPAIRAGAGKHLGAVLLGASFLANPAPTSAQPTGKAVDICSGEAVVDATTGTLLDGKNAHQPMLPASTSKLMTLLLTEDEIAKGTLSPTDTVTFYAPKSRSAPRTETVCHPLAASPQTIKRTLTIEEAELALATVSDNDAALALQQRIEALNDGTPYATMAQGRASALGMKNTHLVEGAGISNSSHCNGTTARYTPASVANDLAERFSVQGDALIEQSRQNITTPYDLALLISHIGEHVPRLRDILGMTSFKINGKKIFKRAKFLLGKAGELIGKTGFTNPAGPSMAAYALSSRISFAVMQCAPTAPIAGKKRDLRAQELFDLTALFRQRTGLPERAVPSILPLPKPESLDTGFSHLLAPVSKPE